MLQQSSGWSLSKETSCYSRQIEALLLLRSQAADATAMQSQPHNRSSDGAEGPETGTAQGGGGGGGEDANVRMLIYLVLERCCLLAESGYKLQAAAESLDALGALTEGQPLWAWDAPDEQGRRTVLRAPWGEDSGGTGGASSGGPSSANVAGDDQRLPRVRAGVPRSVVSLVCGEGAGGGGGCAVL